MQVMVGKTTRAIEIRDVFGRGFSLVAVTKGEGKKETLLGVELSDLGTAEYVAQAIARGMQHATGHMWAYPGCDTAQGCV